MPTRLPAPWEFVAPVPTNKWKPMEEALGIQRTDQDQYRWDRIRNAQSGEEWLIRIHTPSTGCAISGALAVASEGVLRPIDLRSFPVTAISEAYLAHEDRSTAVLHAHLQAGDFPIDEPIGRPDGSDQFYARAATQYLHLQDAGGDASPAQRFATLNAVPLSTAQRWLTRARELRMLPPTSPGRRRRKTDSDAG